MHRPRNYGSRSGNTGRSSNDCCTCRRLPVSNTVLPAETTAAAVTGAYTTPVGLRRLRSGGGADARSTAPAELVPEPARIGPSRPVRTVPSMHEGPSTRPRKRSRDLHQPSRQPCHERDIDGESQRRGGTGAQAQGARPDACAGSSERTRDCGGRGAGVPAGGNRDDHRRRRDQYQRHDRRSGLLACFPTDGRGNPQPSAARRSAEDAGPGAGGTPRGRPGGVRFTGGRYGR